tara:strand:+ start:589 stop:912 length:324 start_codon:yes stop_codon:yes gene_type:complete
MPVVKKVTTANVVAQKKKVSEVSVRSFRSPSTIAEMGDQNFGTLDASKDGLIVTYDSTSNKFILISPDEALDTSASDSDISDSFVDQLEEELDFGQIQAGDVDGGAF